MRTGEAPEIEMPVRDGPCTLVCRVMKHQSAVADRYTVLQRTEKLDGSATDQRLNVARFYEVCRHDTFR